MYLEGKEITVSEQTVTSGLWVGCDDFVGWVQTEHWIGKDDAGIYLLLTFKLPRSAPEPGGRFCWLVRAEQFDEWAESNPMLFRIVCTDGIRLNPLPEVVDFLDNDPDDFCDMWDWLADEILMAAEENTHSNAGVCILQFDLVELNIAAKNIFGSPDIYEEVVHFNWTGEGLYG